MAIQFDIEGLDDLSDAYEEFGREFKKIMLTKLEEAAWIILEASNERVPVDNGDLLRSGYVHIEGDSVFISYSVNYALPVHERTEVHHPNGEAKFLEKAMDANRGLVEEKIAEAFEEALS